MTHNLLYIFLCFFTFGCGDVRYEGHRAVDSNRKISNDTSEIFSVGNVIFNKVNKDTTLLTDTCKNIPANFTKISSKEKIKFHINFQKDYFSYNSIIPNSQLNNDTFYSKVLKKYFIAIYNYEADNPFILSLSKQKFNIFHKKINNYGECIIAIISTEWSNSNQNKCMILVNNGLRELSIWSYDDIKIDIRRNISAQFRLKDNKTTFYYIYNKRFKCFVPVATRNG